VIEQASVIFSAEIDAAVVADAPTEVPVMPENACRYQKPALVAASLITLPGEGSTRW
jgi:hypothetical protein